MFNPWEILKAATQLTPVAHPIHTREGSFNVSGHDVTGEIWELAVNDHVMNVYISHEDTTFYVCNNTGELTLLDMPLESDSDAVYEQKMQNAADIVCKYVSFALTH